MDSDTPKPSAEVLFSHRDDHLIAALAALAIVIHIAESALPTPLPGVKPGLANVITILALCYFGWKIAVWVSLLRVLVGSLVIGTFLAPPFYLSLAGALASLAALGLLWFLNQWHGAWRVGPVGLSVAAAMAHMCGQFWMAYFLFVPHEGIFSLLPVLLTAAVIFGLISGAVAQLIINRLHIEPPELGHRQDTRQ